MVELDIADNLLRGDVDDHDVLAVGSRRTNAGVAINRHNGQLAVRRAGDFMAGNAVLVDGRKHRARCGIDNGHTPIALLGNKQASVLGTCNGDSNRKQHKGKQQLN